MTTSLWADLLGTDVTRLGGKVGTRLLTAGTGAPLLLLHGQGGHAENFRHNIAAFARHHHVLAPDLLWHGLADTPPLADDLIGALVEHIVALLDHLGIDSCRIAGQSMGAWVATELASQHPDRVRALALTTPMGLYADGDEPDLARLARVRAAQLAALSEVTAEGIRQRMSSLFADPHTLDDEIVEVRRRIYAVPRTNAALRGVAERYFSPESYARHGLGSACLAALQMPVLVYWGTANPVPVAAGLRLAAAIPGSRWHCAVAGHWAQYENADEHNEVVLDFLSQT